MVEPKQNNGEVSMATAAAAEVPGKGSVDGKVEEVTGSSGPVQPKSLEGPASANSDIPHQHGSKGKSKLEQGGSEDSSTGGYLASKQAAENAGMESMEQGGPDRNLLGVTGDGVDAKLGSQQEPMKDVVQNKEDENAPLLQSTVPPSIIHCHQTIRKSAMEMEPGTNTHSNPSQGNAASSCKSKTAEWALLVISVGLEAASASCDQVGYALPSMVMAFVALFLAILDLILKARQRGITCDWCFASHSSPDFQNRKPFASLVHYLGLAGALWQCSFTTVGYYYTHQKLVNPIKLCLLPFILALCVLISKVVKSSQLEM